MNYDELKDDFTRSWYGELFRRLEKSGYSIDLINNDRIYANIYLGDALVCQIDNNHEISSDWSGKEVVKIAEETAEYVFAYKTAPMIKCIVSGKTQIGYRKLLSYNDRVFAAKLIDGVGYQFATGHKALMSNNHYFLTKTFNNYKEACEDFAISSGLVNEDKFFHDSELKTIYYALKKLTMKYCNKLTYKELLDIGEVMNKISLILADLADLKEKS